jgi:hypothetical protein
VSEQVEVTYEQADLINGVYRERDQLVAALSKLFPAHLSRHEGAEWDDEWRNIACIHLPAGQVTWHIHDSERWSLFGHLLMQPGHWDGHETDEKYRRLLALPAPGEDIRRPARRRLSARDERSIADALTKGAERG